MPTISIRLLPVGLLAVCTAMGTLAQTNSELPAVLRDMPQSGSMCKNTPLPGGAAPSDARTDQSVDMGCALSAADVNAFLQKSGSTIIDTRQEKDFAQFHIANAIRADVATIRLKNYLRDKPLLLLGDGKTDRELYASCGRLRAQGFKSVQVLMGGMAGYLAKELPVDGRGTPSALEAARLDPAQLWAQSQFRESLVILVDSPKMADILRAPQIADRTPQAIASIVERRRKEQKTPLANVVIVTEGPISEATFRQYGQVVAPTPVLVYSAGPVALKGFLQSQEAVWAARARGPKQPRCG